MSESYNITINYYFKGKEAAKEAKQAKTALQQLATAAKSAAAVALLRYTKQVAKATVEMVKLGAKSMSSRDRLITFAGGAEQASAMLEALGKASDYTIDRLTGTVMASQMLEMGLVTTTKEMEIAGAMVGKLGRQTLSTEARMQSLTLLLANQSRRRLDDFGLSIEQVNAKAKAFEAQGYSTEQAFKLAVFDEANEKLALLGDTSESAQSQINRLEASYETFNQQLAESVTKSIAASGGVEILTGFFDGLTEAMDKSGEAADEAYEKVLRLGGAGMMPGGDPEAMRQLKLAYLEAQGAASGWQKDEDELRRTLEESAQATRVAAREATTLRVAREEARARELQIERVIMAAEALKHDQEFAEKRLAILKRYEKSAAAIAREGHQARMDALRDARDAELAILEAAIEERQWRERLADMEQRHQDSLAAIRNRARETEREKANARYREIMAQLNAIQKARMDALRSQFGEDVTDADKRESLEEEHKRRMMGLYTESARKRERERYAEALKQLEFEEAEADLLEQFQTEKEAAEQAHANELARIKEREIADEIRRENERYTKEVERARAARAQQQADDDARRAIDAQFAADQAQLERDLANEIAGIRAAAFAAELAALDAWRREATARATADPIVVPITLGSPVAGQHWEDYLRSIGVPGYAHGGVSKGGLAIVGEKEPELLNLPRGTSITPMSRMGGVNVINYFGAASVRSERDIRRMAEEQERVFRLRGLGVIQ